MYLQNCGTLGANHNDAFVEPVTLIMCHSNHNLSRVYRC